MPATLTGVSITTFITQTTIASAEMNTNFGAFRGHVAPVDPNTSTFADASYDLGGQSARWRTAYLQSQRLSISTQTSAYTATTTDYFIEANASTSAFTVTLFAAANNTGATLRIKKGDSTFNIVTIDGNGAETIDNTATTTLNTQWETLDLICDGSGWNVSDRRIPTKSTSFTPTTTWSNVTLSAAWWRIGDRYKARIKIYLTGASTATLFESTFLPTSTISVDYTKMANVTINGIAMVGRGQIQNVGTNSYDAFLGLDTLSGLYSFRVYSSDGSVRTSGTGGLFTWAANDYIEAEVDVPITGWES